MLFLGLISVYRNVFLVFCPRILFYYDISVTLFCGQKSFSSRPRNVILRHHNYIIFVVSLYVRAKMKKLTFELFVASSLCTWGRSQRSSPSSCSLPSSLRTWGQSCRRPSPCSSPPWAPPCSSQHDSGVQVGSFVVFFSEPDPSLGSGLAGLLGQLRETQTSLKNSYATTCTKC